MDSELLPFLRWAGGKRWLGPALRDFINSRLSETGRYFEPFLGSGAVFFATQPNKAYLSDLNKDLIVTYRVLAESPKDLIARLRRLPSDATTYYKLRASQPKSPLARATRFIYLNRNCYKGIYRENKRGQFNVPFGGGDRNHFGICKDGTLLNCSRFLAASSIRLKDGDFEQFIRRARRGDVVYCDPTYRKVNREHFDRYGTRVFSWSDQRRLAESCVSAYERGATIIISNACCEELRDLYPNAVVFRAQRKSGITSSDGNMPLDEYLLILDPAVHIVRASVRGRRAQVELFKVLASHAALENQSIGLEI
jgi:DNA adenine methylase